ncbi:hypothetical protein Tco_0820054 [Tanacetum coccineum]|uniref:RNA-directed DNA polymerase, eukaryota, reverse transcriptase zinc-binding domain protein n=1 Tax=Tanacetum coccineum TaxID=301880 RepID=A0ABQ5A8B9_9ASTR
MISAMEIKFLWGNYSFEHIVSEALGNSGVYASQSFSSKCILWALPSSSLSLEGMEKDIGLLSLFLWSTVGSDKNSSDLFGPYIASGDSCRMDFGAIRFRMYHSWFSLSGFDQMITSSWNSFNLDDSNSMIRFRKKLQLLKKEIRSWVSDYKKKQTWRIRNLKDQIRDIDILVDQGGVTDDMLLSRLDLSKQLQDLSSLDHSDFIQKAKVRWAVEGDENSKFCHGFGILIGMSINLKKSQILGMGIFEPVVAMAAKDLGCSVMKITFLYLGVMVGGNMSLAKAWDSTIEKLSMRCRSRFLIRWKIFVGISSMGFKKEDRKSLGTNHQHKSLTTDEEVEGFCFGSGTAAWLFLGLVRRSVPVDVPNWSIILKKSDNRTVFSDEVEDDEDYKHDGHDSSSSGVMQR